ncbi:hypothetical protein C5167_038277 [Papaver somniferum]|uniref:Photosystem I reaction center subunit IX n=1 Tax=Papaver somniferum TaxID=3469 RepID=A0A4Y7ICV2_PAPSO|nr:hypothetical protein C5167_038277 [Papaver somniferum]
MRDIKTYLSVAPVLSTLWSGSLAGLLIEINHLFLDALTFPRTEKEKTKVDSISVKLGLDSKGLRK